MFVFSQSDCMDINKHDDCYLGLVRNSNLPVPWEKFTERLQRYAISSGTSFTIVFGRHIKMGEGTFPAYILLKNGDIRRMRNEFTTLVNRFL